MVKKKEEPKGEVVKVQEKTTVYATGTGKPQVAKGGQMSVHPILAEKLIAAGKATAEAPKK